MPREPDAAYGETWEELTHSSLAIHQGRIGLLVHQTQAHWKLIIPSAGFFEEILINYTVRRQPLTKPTAEQLREFRTMFQQLLEQVPRANEDMLRYLFEKAQQEECALIR